MGAAPAMRGDEEWISGVKSRAIDMTNFPHGSCIDVAPKSTRRGAEQSGQRKSKRITVLLGRRESKAGPTLKGEAIIGSAIGCLRRGQQACAQGYFHGSAAV